MTNRTDRITSGVSRWTSDWGVFGARWYAWVRELPKFREEGPPRMFKWQARRDEKNMRRKLGA